MPLPYGPPPKSPIVDTNILFDFLVWRFHTETGTRIHPSLLQHISSEPMDALKWYLDASKPIRTAFHVVAELHGLTKKRTQRNPEWTSETRGWFWRLVRDELTQIHLEEHPVRIADMSPEDLAQLGPTDASILVLAIRFGAVVLTEDRPLANRCAARQITVHNYDTVLELWKQSVL